MQSRSIIAWSPGASSGVTSFAPIARQPELVREEELGHQQAADEDEREHRAGAGRGEHADEHHVEEAEQEEREQHPELETPVTGEYRALLRIGQ